MSKERIRLQEAREGTAPWKKWGPYLSERQWGTVREDYSADGSAWDYFSHDQARSRVYRWGEDGIAGVSDDHQRLCFALALWNGKDPILKERLFGLTNSEGNHGEDVKEYYYYLDSTPTHSYMKYLYKYPQAAYPYSDIVDTNRRRNRNEPEYELIDTGVFKEDRYFDVIIEYAKAAPDDVLIRIRIHNRGPEAAALHVLPTVWFRNTWSGELSQPRPQLKQIEGRGKSAVIASAHPNLGVFCLHCEGDVPLLFTENESNTERLFGTPNVNPYVKDGIHNAVVHGRVDLVNPNQIGTKAAAHYQITVGAGEFKEIRLRLVEVLPDKLNKTETPAAVDLFGRRFDQIFDERLREADEFFAAIVPPGCDADAANVMRQALAGMLWGKQYYYLDANQWLDEHQAHPLKPNSRHSRNREWVHMVNDHIISMPDKWEYPWYAAWDLAFHAVALAAVDPDFAKDQLELMLSDHYLHPSGQIPAYEWNFSDVNPPVHAWATLFLARSELGQSGKLDTEFLKSIYHRLLCNFTWWLNRKDRSGKNVFEGGFLGLDNIGVFDRSAPLPTGGYLEQADGTAWMAFFCQNMIELGIRLATQDPNYEELVSKFVDHFLWIAAGMNRPGEEGMWDEEDGFYYDVLRLPDGTAQRLKVRSMVGLLPLCAATVVEPWQRDIVAKSAAHWRERARQMPDLMKNIHPTGPGHLGVGDRGIVALLNPERLRRVLSKMLDEQEFLSPYGIRSLSKFHEKHPYVVHVDGQEHRVDYSPAESTTGAFGGNSNWRGPIWLPVNVLIIRSLLSYYLYYGDKFCIECPTGSGRLMNLFEVAKEIADRLTRIFLRDSDGRRPVYGDSEKFQSDPHWRDDVLFYEYFHGDNGAGIGASHQTGWTGVVATLIQLFGTLNPQTFLEVGKMSAFERRSGMKAEDIVVASADAIPRKTTPVPANRKVP
ncbi:MAG TPA: glucosidase [Phycisphaerae bacterium]|nr:glucosidase [Phycisphaerae bacterium]